jgi:glycosyltransferase involved in cell wall biosynthesis
MPARRHDTLVIVPVHGEAATIARVVEGVRRHPVDVLVVDDGSPDDSGARAQAAGAEVLRLAANRGKGSALQEGLRVARERGYPQAVSLDGDLEHDPAELPRFLAALAEGHDLVVGQRDVFRSGARRLVNGFANYWYRQVDPRITDTICGYRGFRPERFADLRIEQRGFEFEQILLLEAFVRGWRVTFVPVTIRTAAKTGVRFRDLIRANNAFDRWVLEHADGLPLSAVRRRFLRAAARVGLVLGGVLERVAR